MFLLCAAFSSIMSLPTLTVVELLNLFISSLNMCVLVTRDQILCRFVQWRVILESFKTSLVGMSVPMDIKGFKDFTSQFIEDLLGF
jgi:hypothetical protein